MRHARLAAVGTLLAVVAVLAPHGPATGNPASQRPAAVQAQADDTKEGLAFRLGDAGDEPPPPRPPATPAQPLGDADVQKILDRLPRLATEAGEATDFALRETSLPPPRTGRTVQAAFPPAEGRDRPTEAEAGPLRVLRRQPEGDVPLAPHLSVTFSQPMVAVTSHDELARDRAPVRLTPEPPGRWRWVGTRTLLFEVSPRLPMATAYRAEVPAGTRSATGGALAAAERWTFRTPAATVVASHPKDGPARRDGLLFAAFDQKIDPAAVLATVRVEAGGATRAVRLATPDEVKADDEVRRRAESAEPGRWLAFRTQEPLPPDAAVTVTVGPGTPSAEGPLETDQPQPWGFRTFGPLRVTGHECGWDRECPPGAPWRIEFSNPIDAKRFRKEQVQVMPPLPGLVAHVYGSTLQLSGRARGRSRYRVTISTALADSFGQTLPREANVDFDVTAAPAALWSSNQALVTLDPGGPPRLSVYVVNQKAVRVRAWSVTPADWSAYRMMLQQASRREPFSPPGRAILDREVPLTVPPDEVSEVGLDVSPALPGGRGHAIVVVDRAPLPLSHPEHRVTTWVQATSIGLDAFVDRGTPGGRWPTSISSSRPGPTERRSGATRPAWRRSRSGRAPTSWSPGAATRPRCCPAT
jgi:hypothetical protein